VILQVPYANIAQVICEREAYGFKQLRVGVDLHRPTDPSTFARGQKLSRKDPDSRDLHLPTFFTAGPEEIAREIARRCGETLATGT
jgi:hypothetical protein